METELINSYEYTFSLIDNTFKLKDRIKIENILEIIHNTKQLCIRINNESYPVIENTKIKAEQIILLNDKLNNIVNKLITKIKNNPDNYIFNNTEKKIYANKCRSYTKISKRDIMDIEEDNENELMKIRNIEKDYEKLGEQDAKNVLNTNKNVMKFTHFINERENEFSVLILDRTKDRNKYRTNYVFKTDKLIIMERIISDVKKISNLKKLVLVVREINKELIYIMHVISEKEYHPYKYMVNYINDQWNGYSIENRLNIIKNLGYPLDTIE